MNKSKEIRFDPDRSFVYIKLYCTLTLELLKEVFEEITTSSQFSADMVRIWDINDADLSSIDDETLKKISIIPTSQQPEVSQGRVAIVSNQPLSESLIKLFLIHAKDLNQLNLEIFKTKEQAEAWGSRA